ncbi:hypothetical protein [Halochromatium roseum]|uniref:hypothetical protein n=1 Tax=Halochromatium roseum TaxID=391920 RepID=UPI0019126724|nr:hypothetical protein [Halochromatium roseum]MBK5938226.1 hypothetical protein [Halochromatium roseum]MCF7996206.1 hypothetical protein [Chromatiaceae bacterium]MCF8016406.1 hypothetical protein [Chromatiaceae bacterium]
MSFRSERRSASVWARCELRAMARALRKRARMLRRCRLRGLDLNGRHAERLEQRAQRLERLTR